MASIHILDPTVSAITKRNVSVPAIYCREVFNTDTTEKLSGVRCKLCLEVGMESNMEWRVEGYGVAIDRGYFYELIDGAVLSREPSAGSTAGDHEFARDSDGAREIVRANAAGARPKRCNIN